MLLVDSVFPRDGLTVTYHRVSGMVNIHQALTNRFRKNVIFDVILRSEPT